MDAILLARLQFAMTISFHYIFPPITIGMAWLIFWMQCRYLKTGDALYQVMTRFWLKLFAITFAIGVATGITMEFQFGTNWAAYSRMVGDIFGAPLAAEGILAFFLESTFVGIMFYGEKKVSKRVFWLSSLLVALGSTLSAFWIIVANSWQQTPAGFHMVNGRAELTNFFEAAFNPSTMPRYLHTINGALVTGAFVMMGIAAFYLIKRKHERFARESLKMSLVVGFIAAVSILPTAHYHGVQVSKTQPIKLAAFEGHWESRTHAPMILFAIPDEKNERNLYEVAIPDVLSILVGRKSETYVTGLKDVIKEERPPVAFSFIAFHLMIYLAGYFILVTSIGVFLLYRNQLYTATWYHRILLFSIPLPTIANEIGWAAAEVGRQPWIVQGILKTKDAVSVSVPAYQLLISIILFAVVYSFLFAVWIFLLKKKIQEGPQVI